MIRQDFAAPNHCYPVPSPVPGEAIKGGPGQASSLPTPRPGAPGNPGKAPRARRAHSGRAPERAFRAHCFPSRPARRSSPTTAGLGATSTCDGLSQGEVATAPNAARPGPGGPGPPAPSVNPARAAPRPAPLRTLRAQRARLPSACCGRAGRLDRSAPPAPRHRTHPLRAAGARRPATGPPAVQLWPRSSGRPWLRDASASVGTVTVALGSEQRPREP